MMRSILTPFIALLLGVPALAQAPREESPAPREILEAFGEGRSDADLARITAAAAAFPLGTLENPIRTGGPEGAHAYLVRLRCPDGSVPVVSPRVSGGVGAFGSITDRHDVTCGPSGPTAALIFDLYHEGYVERRAPRGFAIEPRP